MKGIFKKNQIIITALAALIAVAGYLNYTERNDREKEVANSVDNKKSESVSVENLQVDSPVENSEETTTMEDYAQKDTEEVPGEAVFVNGTGTVDFIAEARLSKEYARNVIKEQLKQIVDNKDISAEEKKSAIDKIVDLDSRSERELAAENLLVAKGFENISVTMTDEAVDVVVVCNSLTDSQKIQIEDVVKTKLNVTADRITINVIETENNKDKEKN